MRFFARVLVCVVAAAAVAGCNPFNDKRYMNEGAGIELGYADLSESTKQQDAYVRAICHQTKRPSEKAADEDVSCPDEIDWDKFVLTGINDINRRCDAYLTWLEAKRRDRAPFLREIVALNGASQSILASAGADAGTLGIVAAAVALAGSSYENWNSRLLLAINHSTVVDIVYSRQQQFMDGMRSSRFNNRPAAIYTLRNYLRLCMPTTIEADINTSMTLVQRGSLSDARERPIVPLVGARQFELNVNTPITETRKSATILNPAKGTVEETLPFAVGIRIQRALCLQKATGDFGEQGSDTRQSLKVFKAGVRAEEADSQQGVIKDAADRADIMNAVDMFPDCKAAGFKSAYEVGAFTRHSAPKIKRLLAKGLEAVVTSPTASLEDKNESQRLMKAFAAFSQPKAAVMNPDVGKAITILSRFYGLPERSRIDQIFLKKLELNTAV